jgi:hypothetical protein
VFTLATGLSWRATETADAFDLKGKILGFTLGLFFLLSFFVSWSWWVARRNVHRWATYVYAFFLLVAAGIFVYIAVEAPKVRRK